MAVRLCAGVTAAAAPLPSECKVQSVTLGDSEPVAIAVQPALRRIAAQPRVEASPRKKYKAESLIASVNEQLKEIEIPSIQEAEIFRGAPENFAKFCAKKAYALAQLGNKLDGVPVGLLDYGKETEVGKLRSRVEAKMDQLFALAKEIHPTIRHDVLSPVVLSVWDYMHPCYEKPSGDVPDEFADFVAAIPDPETDLLVRGLRRSSIEENMQALQDRILCAVKYLLVLRAQILALELPALAYFMVNERIAAYIGVAQEQLSSEFVFEKLVPLMQKAAAIDRETLPNSQKKVVADLPYLLPRCLFDSQLELESVEDGARYFHADSKKDVLMKDVFIRHIYNLGCYLFDLQELISKAGPVVKKKAQAQMNRVNGALMTLKTSSERLAKTSDPDFVDDVILPLLWSFQVYPCFTDFDGLEFPDGFLERLPDIALISGDTFHAKSEADRKKELLTMIKALVIFRDHHKTLDLSQKENRDCLTEIQVRIAIVMDRAGSISFDFLRNEIMPELTRFNEFKPSKQENEERIESEE
jgi:hypothetical protein